MSFNITLVAFGHEPDCSDEKILSYRGFDKDLIGKETAGAMYVYDVKTNVPGAVIRHVQVRDKHVDSNNMVLIFPNVFSNVLSPEDAVFHSTLRLIEGVLFETVLRTQCLDPDKIETLGTFEGSLVICFNDVKQAIEDDTAKASRNSLKLVK